jgi:hypothetical protein
MSGAPTQPPLAGTFGQGFVPNIADVDTYPRAPLGTMMAMADGRMFRYVQFYGSAAVAPGQVVCYTAADDNQTQVDLPNNNRGAGVSPNAVPASSSLQYSWVQTRGLVQLAAAVSGTPAAGSPLSTTGATAGGLAAVSVATAPVYGKFILAAGNRVSVDFPW